MSKTRNTLNTLNCDLSPDQRVDPGATSETLVEYGMDEFTVTAFADGRVEIIHFSDDTRESEVIDTDDGCYPDGLLGFAAIAVAIAELQAELFREGYL